MNKNVNGILNLEDQRNNLVLTSDEKNSFGTVFYNLDKDDSDKHLYYFFNCTKLYFRIPGEHIIDEKKFDMELQFNCTGEIPGDKSHNLKYVFVAIPVIAVEDTQEQSNFFKNFESLQNVSTENLPYSLSIDSFDEVLNPFNMFNKIFFYSGSVNYPECMIGANWIVIENPILIRKSLSQAFLSLLDKEQIQDGNSRKAVPKSEDYFILENKFSVLIQ
jgi:carbonic anhydrase